MKGPKGGAIGCEAEFGASFLTFHLGRSVSPLTTEVDVIALVGHSFLHDAACADTHKSDRLKGTQYFLASDPAKCLSANEVFSD